VRATTLERAFDLAASGEYVTTGAIAKALKAEGYSGVEPLLAQDAVRRRLRRIIVDAREQLVGIVIEDASVDVVAVADAAQASGRA